MRVVIAGSRKIHRYTDEELVWLVADAVIKSGWRESITQVVSGGARGIDIAGEIWASSVFVPVKLFMADWGLHGKAAGPIRNAKMAEYADALIAIWDGSSRGTLDMISQMKELGKPIYAYLVLEGAQ